MSDIEVIAGAVEIEVIPPSSAASIPIGVSVPGPKGDKGDQGDIGPAGADGPPGAQGVPGPAGPAGADGNTIHYGEGAPSDALGSDGDTYVSTSPAALYGPKAGGSWPAGISLASGGGGHTVLSGAGAPAGGTGFDGDYYIDTAATTIFGPKAAGAWPAGVSIIGPQGPAGAQGPAGPQGPAGADGAQGPQGIQGPAGLDGADGAQGIQGPAGPAGADGAQGPQGIQGIQGPAGPQGPAGLDGADGADGAQGIQGPAGPAGPAGADGADGAVGPAGPTGPEGPSQVSSTDVATPASGSLALIRQVKAGRDFLGTKNSSGKRRGIQHSLLRQRAAFMNCGLGALHGFGVNVATVTGTQSNPAPAAGSIVTRQRRTLYTSAATANAGAGWNDNTVTVYPISGFFAGFVFSIEDAAAVGTARHCAGFKAASTAIGGSDPSTFIDCIFVGADAGDTNLQLMHNDATGSCTKIDLGIDKGLTGEIFEATFFIEPEGTELFYQLVRLSNGDTVSGSVTTDLPTQTTGLRPFIHRGNGATAAAVAVGVFNYYLETEY